MIQKKQIYKCKTCGNMVEVLRVGGGQLVCCGAPMELQVEKTEDAGNEKHVPVMEKIDGGIRVKVGEISHPMDEGHFIEWIEATADGQTYKKFLNPGDQPEAEFQIVGEIIEARAYCNVHGLWKSK
jgi:superoxide reductase